MRIVLYNIFLFLFKIAAFCIYPFNNKAKKWVTGRKDIFNRLETSIIKQGELCWVHCASLGEFEQGRPVIEAIRSAFPSVRILLTFFSPSGFEVQKNYAAADWVFYLPMDGPKNAKRFLDITNPKLVIFVKYDLWYYYLRSIRQKNIPLILVSAILRDQNSILNLYAKLHVKMLQQFDMLFLQNKSSAKMAESFGLKDKYIVAGDTRFDRVTRIANSFEPIDKIDGFVKQNKIIVAGSTWPSDEKVLSNAWLTIKNHGFRLIIAPHEISEKKLASIKDLFPNSVLFSELNNESKAEVLIIDNIGMLSRLYKYAFITYVGGGLHSSGIHNILEAAVYDKIVIFGPEHHRAAEAKGLLGCGGGFTFSKQNTESVEDFILKMLSNGEEYAIRSKAAGDFVRSGRGATNIIMDYIQEKRLLTN